MKRPILLAIISALSLLLVRCGDDQPPPPHRQVEDWHPPAEMLEKYAGKDGVVSRAAMEAGLRADFAKADTDGNGCLDDNEARTVNEERWNESASAASPLIDFEHTGCISFDEFAATPRSLFDQLDKKGDGHLTPEELHPGHKKVPPPGSTAPEKLPGI